MSVSAPGAQYASEWHNIIAGVRDLGFTFGTPTLGQTWQHNDPLSPNSEHLQGRAVDFGDATSPSAAIARALVPYAQGPNAPIDELIFAPLGIGYKKGQNIGEAGYGAATWAGHFDHVHVGVRPGADLAAAVKGGPVPGGYTPPPPCRRQVAQRHPRPAVMAGSPPRCAGCPSRVSCSVAGCCSSGSGCGGP